ncbi:MAG: hypothetical protein IPK62_02100 [Bacteroidetes bacterium]|nr:hypothetical protein [Bacteroidota bacterium]
MNNRIDLDKKINERINRVVEHEWGTLDLKNCGLTEIPAVVFKQTHLVNIDLSNDKYCDDEHRNKLVSIPKEISNLTKLYKLNLANNEICEVSEEISKLKELSVLIISNNKLTELSPKIANMKSLKELHLEGNPFDMLPPEIVSRGIERIRNFYKELEESDFLYEVKLIIVGQGRVGKTCISKALVTPNYKLEDTESTEGININSWIIPQKEISKINPSIQRDFQINIWDFGGQEIYHSTHQFFLTKRSIYMLVTESRKEDSHDDFYYWLNIIKLLGDQSPVLVVLNKCDQPTKELPIKEYKESFSNIKDFHKISLKSDYENTLTDFKESIKKIASSLPHIGNRLPKKWVDIRIELEDLKLKGKNYITETEYFDICKKHYRNQEGALFLSDYFHDLGVILHFRDDLELKDTVILNNEWITGGVYKILDDKKVIDSNGKFDNSDLQRILSDVEYKYKVKELLSLMKNKKFDLCFELEQGMYLVPRLLPVDEVEHNWKSDSNNLKFEYRYKFMPKGILARLIVKLNKDIYQNIYWRYGVVLHYQNTHAIVKEKYFENKITIEISGDYKREYLFMIRKSIEEIHRDFNKLGYTEMIPCCCKECLSNENPHFFGFDILRRYELNNLPKIRCDNSLEEVLVSTMTSNIGNNSISDTMFIFCENQNEKLLNLLGFENVIFYPEKNSNGVFIQTKSDPDKYGLRDRDYLLDSEIERLKVKYKKYIVLDYYCFENYLYHPDNIAELKLIEFNKEEYIEDIIRQKNENKDLILSNFKSARKSYQEFKLDAEKIQDKDKENDIIKYLQSNEIETFFKSFSMKDYYNKDKTLSRYSLKPKELVMTKWFNDKMNILILNRKVE